MRYRRLSFVLPRAARPGADAVFSGLLESDREEYEERLSGLGLMPRARRRSGDWAAPHARLLEA